jgi:hypothetical protein
MMRDDSLKMRVNMSQESEQKTRRGVELHKANPFISTALVEAKIRRITNKNGDMMIVGKETGELIAPIAGFWQSQEVDSAKFVKLYVNGVRAFRDLTNSGTKVFELLYLEVQKNIGKDKVFMSFSLVDQAVTPMAPSTYKRGMHELITKGFLAATPVQGWYWLNPDYMWNGDRLAFVKAYHKASTQLSLLP